MDHYCCPCVMCGRVFSWRVLTPHSDGPCCPDCHDERFDEHVEASTQWPFMDDIEVYEEVIF